MAAIDSRSKRVFIARLRPGMCVHTPEGSWLRELVALDQVGPGLAERLATASFLPSDCSSRTVTGFTTHSRRTRIITSSRQPRPLVGVQEIAPRRKALADRNERFDQRGDEQLAL